MNATTRADRLASQITAATGAEVQVSVTISVDLPTSVAADDWTRLLAALGALPIGDQIGGERNSCGAVRLWATLHDSLSEVRT
jgi:hypothetical protein